MRLVHAHEGAATGDSAFDRIVGNANHVLECYGIRQFFADIDSAREFWRDGGGIIGSVLDHISTAGFHELCVLLDMDFYTPHEYRQRYVVNAILRKGGRR